MAARRSILSSARPTDRGSIPQSVAASSPEPVTTVGASAATRRPSRIGKFHVGGYYDSRDPTVVAFQKLGIELRQTQQQMLLEAMGDFVAKHQAADAFKG